MPDDTNLVEREIAHVDPATMAMLNSSEIDQQITTAHRFPRNIKLFRNEVLSLATLTEDIAAECSYALSRKDKNGQKKVIEGPSARFAEIVAHSWGNVHAGARVVDDRGGFVKAQGAFWDLEKNVKIFYEVQRSIVGSSGNRFSQDMIGVTANAACSIALRNSVLKGVPKALWADLWEQARKVAVGDEKTLANRRATAFAKFAHFGIGEDQILRKLDRASVPDVTVDDVAILLGIFTSIKEGEVTPEQAFADDSGPSSSTVPGPQSKTTTTAPATTTATTTTAETQQQPATATTAATEQPAQTAPSGNIEPRGPGYVTAGMLNMLAMKTKKVGKTIADVCAQFGVEGVRDLTIGQGNEALDWLKTFAQE